MLGRKNAFVMKKNTNIPSNSRLLAAADLGSNSFRLEIDRYAQARFTRKSYNREPVRLGRGLRCDLTLDQEAMERGWACLKRFGKILHREKIPYVRAVATQTLRQATNRDDFLKKGNKLLGHPIEVISGEEEAQLIYLGVTSLLQEDVADTQATDAEKRLVIDIGGRSTELVVGTGTRARVARSTPVGSVGLSMDFFNNGILGAAEFDDAVAAAREQFISAAAAMQTSNGAPLVWDAAYGASGTIGSISSVLKINHMSDGLITRDGLHWIHSQLLHAGSLRALQMPGLGDRKDVVGGGLSVLLALFEVFPELTAITPARGALRQGVLQQMIQAAAK